MIGLTPINIQYTYLKASYHGTMSGDNHAVAARGFSGVSFVSITFSLFLGAGDNDEDDGSPTIYAVPVSRVCSIGTVKKYRAKTSS